MPITIHGCGLAGVFVGWHLWQRGISFRHVGERRIGASHAAAGLVNPVTGKGMNLGWRIDEFIDEMREFYLDTGSMLGRQYFHEMPVLRVFTGEKERAKFLEKKESLSPWIGKFYDALPDVKDAEWGGVEWVQGGWIDVRGFLQDSLEFFRTEGLGAEGPEVEVYCEGTKGLQEGLFSFLPKRLAKGEILEVRIPDWKEHHILNRRGWCIPIGNDIYRIGATYEWEDLSIEPTTAGRAQLEGLIREFTDHDFELVEHITGVRPIVRNSEPVTGEHPDEKGKYVLNGLGSKGCLYGPKVARQLVELILDGQPVEDYLCLQSLLNR